MSDVSIFGERSGSTPDRAASAPLPPVRRNPCKGLFGAIVVNAGAVRGTARTMPPGSLA